KIVEAARENSADMVALSALMSTTAARLEEVVRLLRENGMRIPVMVGGAVVTTEFASEIGAVYGGDAYSAVETASKLLNR
ncbi:MAG TPA: cobalamin-dependent protein, partial [Candidatus Sabulitectum sp.]|nr:cobalamin-dependent protein [Candidatus Sabulitectum sp.]